MATAKMVAAKSARSSEGWSEVVRLPDAQGVVYERTDKGDVLYVRQRHGGVLRKASLAAVARTAGHAPTLRDERGRPLVGRARAEREAWAVGVAAEQLRVWVAADRGEAPAKAPPAKPLTVGDTAALLTDPDTGKYPTAPGAKPDHHAREVLRSLAYAARVLGAGRAWAAVDADALTTVWRHRIRAAAAVQGRRAKDTPGAHDGLRAAEVIVRDLLAAATWLRDRGKIPAVAGIAPRTWRQMLRADWVKLRGAEARTSVAPAPKRPRHTEAEVAAILAAAPAVDPRLALLLELGAELRSGQVERAMRSHVDMHAGKRGVFTVYGRGKKKGEAVHLTAGQLRAFVFAVAPDGYLHPLEEARVRGAIADYPLFPAGQMPGGRRGEPVTTVERHAGAGFMSRKHLQTLFREAEANAGVTPVAGRVFYGLRRSRVDSFKRRGISREGLQAAGGWSDSQMPDRVYADDEMTYAREEAAQVRAQVRGEVDNAPEANT